MTTAASRDDTIVEEITIRASAARIFEALTDPQQRTQWWGAEGSYRATHTESDLRPGGKWSTSGTGFGKPFRVRGEYRIVERPRVLAFTWIPDWQENAGESLVRFDLVETDGVTTVRLTHSGLAPQARQAHRGWPRMLGWLRDHVEAA